MKKFFTIILLGAIIFSFCACGNISPINSVINNQQNYTIVTETEFNELLIKQPVNVKSVKYVVQDEKYKSLYPDILQAVIENNSNSDIKNATVAFVAWDKNNLPVKLKGSIDFNEATYIREVNYPDINLVPGEEYGHNSGYKIDENCNVDHFKAIVKSYETFDGIKWDNPYYNAWKTMYSGVKHTDTLTTKVAITKDDIDTSKESANSSSTDTNMSDEASSDINTILAEIEQQKVKVIETNYVVQDDKYKNLYPDMLQAIIINNGDVDIKNIIIAFVAWDKNKLPVKIKGSIDFSDGSYVKKVSYEDVNLVPGDTYGNNSGYEIDENNNIEYFKAIVVSYETFDGTSWDNPHFYAWEDYYSGSKYSE